MVCQDDLFHGDFAGTQIEVVGFLESQHVYSLSLAELVTCIV